MGKNVTKNKKEAFPLWYREWFTEEWKQMQQLFRKIKWVK